MPNPEIPGRVFSNPPVSGFAINRYAINWLTVLLVEWKLDHTELAA